VHDGYEYSPPATVSITVEAPVPTALALLPNCGGPSDAPLALKVQGTGFVSDSVVRWNGADRPVTSVTPTEITATIGASDLATPATSTVTIYSSGPGGGTSNGLLFRIGQPAIQLVSVTVTKSGGVARARVTLKNAGAGTARALKVTIGKIQKSGFAPVSTTTALPIVLGDLAPGATVDVTPDLQFPGTSANVGDTVQVTVGGTYTGGSYNGWRKATVTAP
jgi:hypothetical protein